jgi:hypothetical protein
MAYYSSCSCYIRDGIGRYRTIFAIWVDESIPYLGPLAAVSDPQAV